MPIGILSGLTCLFIVIVRGGNPVAIKVVLQALSPMPGAFARVAIGCAGVGLFAAVQRRDLRPARGEIGPLLLLAAIYAVQIAAIQTGTDFTSPVLVAILFNTYPIIANLLASFVVPEDRLTPKRTAGLAIAFSGVTWILLSRTESALAPNPMLGNALILAGASLLAVRMVYIRQLVLQVDYVKAVFWTLLGSLPCYLIAGVLIPDPMVRTQLDLSTWVSLLYQGILVGGVGQLAWVFLIRRHTPGAVTAFSFVTPVSGLVVSAAYFSEPVSSQLLTGFAAVLLGIALAVRRAPPTSKPDSLAPPRGFGGTA